MEPTVAGKTERLLPLPVRMLLRLVAMFSVTIAALALLVGLSYALISGPLLLFSLWWEIRD